MRQIEIDGNAIFTSPDLHKALAEALSFPEYYGRNFDALYDCLTDLEGIEITISAPAEDGAVFQKILRIFKAADRINESLKLNLL